VSTLAGEVPMPHKTFPRALFAAVVLVVVTYALPLMVGLGVTQDTEHRWKLGYFAEVAKEASPPPPPFLLSTPRLLSWLCTVTGDADLVERTPPVEQSTAQHLPIEMSWLVTWVSHSKSHALAS